MNTTTTTKNFAPSKYQQAIFDFITNGSGNAVISAVAGSGKTTTLVNAMELIPSDKKVIFMAFNKSIAEELTKKIPNSPNIQIKTLHAFGMGSLLRQFKCQVESGKYRTMLKAIYEYTNGNGNLTTLSKYNFRGEHFAMIDTMKIPDNTQNKTGYINRVLSLCDLGRVNVTTDIEQLNEIAIKHNIELQNGEIEQAIKLINLGTYYTAQIDFTDMIFLPIALNISVFQFDFIFIDECQDLNTAQRLLMMKAIKPKVGRFIAVGDENQAIYGFAGADSDSFIKLCAIPNTTMLPLSVCYRCGKDIVNLAKSIVPQIEASETAKQGIIDYNFSYSEVKTEDMVICRNTFPLVALCLRYLSEGKKAFVMGSEIGRSLAKMIEETKVNGREWNMAFVLSAFQVEREKIVSNVMRKQNLTQSEAEETSIVNLYDEKVNVINLLSQGINEPQIVINKLLSIFSDDNGKGICLSTIHKSKGLEADRVFIIHSELMPSKYAKKDWEKQQEQNLIYVAYTRAKSLLGFITDFNAYEKGESNSGNTTTQKTNSQQISEFQGIVGDKLQLQAEVIDIKTILNTAYGNTTIFTLKDSNGNLFSKFGVINERFIVSNHKQIEQGTIIKCSAMIKEHKEYKGVKYTIISTLSKY